MTKPIATILVLCGASMMSFVGVLIRLLDEATRFQILFYRSVSLTLMVLLVVCIRPRTTPSFFIKSIDKHDLLVGGWLSLAFTTYIFSMLWSSVVSTLLIITIALFLAAVIAWKWIGKAPHPVTWPTMVVATFGVFIRRLLCLRASAFSYPLHPTHSSGISAIFVDERHRLTKASVFEPVHNRPTTPLYLIMLVKFFSGNKYGYSESASLVVQLKTSRSPSLSKPTATTSPSLKLPSNKASASGFCSLAWITRCSGRAPNCGS